MISYKHNLVFFDIYWELLSIMANTTEKDNHLFP